MIASWVLEKGLCNWAWEYYDERREYAASLPTSDVLSASYDYDDEVMMAIYKYIPNVCNAHIWIFGWAYMVQYLYIDIPLTPACINMYGLLLCAACIAACIYNIHICSSRDN
jgi:hypothetical protein